MGAVHLIDRYFRLSGPTPLVTYFWTRTSSCLNLRTSRSTQATTTHPSPMSSAGSTHPVVARYCWKRVFKAFGVVTNIHFQELDGFDSSIFWTAGLLWKFFSTCGVETWDRDFGELVGPKIPFKQPVVELGWTLQELERMGAHGAQLGQRRGGKKEGGGEEGRLCQRSEVKSDYIQYIHF